MSILLLSAFNYSFPVLERLWTHVPQDALRSWLCSWGHERIDRSVSDVYNKNKGFRYSHWRSETGSFFKRGRSQFLNDGPILIITFFIGTPAAVSALQRTRACLSTSDLRNSNIILYAPAQGTADARRDVIGYTTKYVLVSDKRKNIPPSYTLHETNLYWLIFSWSNIITKIRSRRIRWARRVARIGEKNTAFRFRWESQKETH